MELKNLLGSVKIYIRNLQEASPESIQLYKEYRNVLNTLKRKTKKNYYNKKCLALKNNTKQLWELINRTIGKKKNTGSIILYISIDGIKTYSPDWIANAFGSFYANLDSNLANHISPGNTGIDYYLKQIPRSLQSFVMARTTKEEVERVIKSLPNKQSCGHDKISNTVLKKLNEASSYPLMSIFNQSIAQGIFPNLMKVAKIIPLYKEKERDLVVNYRPVSLLMTISKVLEKIISVHLYKYLEKINYYLTVNMVFNLSDLVNTRYLN